MTTRTIAVLPGDGIGPEIVAQGIKVLRTIEKKFGIAFELGYAAIGGEGIREAGVPLPDSTLNLARQADAVFMGSVGDYQFDTLEPHLRPEQGLLQIRKALGLFANLRPIKAYDALLHVSTLKPEVLTGVDVLVVRELTGGLYFGQPKKRDSDSAIDTMVYTRMEIERIARLGFELAMQRSKRLCSVDKANVLATSQLWRDVVIQLSAEYPEVELSHMYVDNAAMQLVRKPRQFDVLLTENTFGDILSDEASMLIGSLGMLSSASLGEDETGKRNALYEPSHGSAPDIAGQNKANPIATILSLALMLETTFQLKEAATCIHDAIGAVLDSGRRTVDIADSRSTIIGTDAMGDAICEAVLKGASVVIA